MTEKFKSGRSARRLNQIIDDVSIEKTKVGRNSYTQTFGVVRCFLLTDTSSTPMVATGVKWDGTDWVENGLGDAVGVYPNPNFTYADYQDDQYIFARNFGGRWFSIDPAVAGTSSSFEIRKAYCTEAAPADATIAAELDAVDSADAITVYCPISGGTALNAAIPRLADEDLIFVWNDGGTWRTTFVFQATEDCE